MITKQESEFLIAGLMRYVNKKESDLLDLAEEKEDEDFIEVIENLEKDRVLREKINFALNLIKKIEKLTDEQV